MKICLGFILAVLVSSSVRGQDDFENLLQAGEEDANKLVGGYISPVLNAIGFGLNQGWYNTAKPHKSAGFDLTFTVSAVYVPNADLFYDTKSLGLKEVELVTPTDGKAPTFYGPAITPVYRYKSAPSVTFNGPPGVDPPKLGSKHVFPVPIFPPSLRGGP